MMPVSWLLNWVQHMYQTDGGPPGGVGRHVDGVSDDLFFVYTLICVGLILLAALMSGVSTRNITKSLAPCVGALTGDAAATQECMTDVLCQ
jgi:hypothetical protein